MREVSRLPAAGRRGREVGETGISRGGGGGVIFIMEAMTVQEQKEGRVFLPHLKCKERK